MLFSGAQLLPVSGYWHEGIRQYGRGIEDTKMGDADAQGFE